MEGRAHDRCVRRQPGILHSFECLARGRQQAFLADERVEETAYIVVIIAKRVAVIQAVPLESESGVTDREVDTLLEVALQMRARDDHERERDDDVACPGNSVALRISLGVRCGAVRNSNS